VAVAALGALLLKTINRVSYAAAAEWTAAALALFSLALGWAGLVVAGQLLLSSRARLRCDSQSCARAWAGSQSCVMSSAVGWPSSASSARAWLPQPPP
jgi:hypothetical protein